MPETHEAAVAVKPEGRQAADSVLAARTVFMQLHLAGSFTTEPLFRTWKKQK